MTIGRITALIAFSVAIGAFAWTFSPLSAQNQDAVVSPPPNPDAVGGPPRDANYQVLTRGPVHEAFAETYNTNPVEGVIVKKTPPPDIDEVPPSEAPEGQNVIWIPGYWGWDPEQNDFIWISGLWRDVPPDQRWVPGYWNRAANGYQWVSGFWSPIQKTELTYLPTPPESLEEGPNVEPPSGDYFWIPGLWTWANTTYQWRPGYWAPAYEDWMWMPAHYAWTPYGCVYVDGYWDYVMLNRGTLFSPVYFQTPIYTQPNFVFTPAVVVDVPGLMVHLFVAPNYCHYYFGDYYAYNGSFGILPWYTVESRARYYDPLLTYYQWSYGRRGIDFTSRLHAWNTYFVGHPDLRPPHTWRQQRDFLDRHRDNPDFRTGIYAMGRSYDQFVKDSGEDRRFRRLDDKRRDDFRDTARTIRALETKRGDTERQSRREETAGRPNAQGRPVGRLKLPEITQRAEVGGGAAGPRREGDARPGDVRPRDNGVVKDKTAKDADRGGRGPFRRPPRIPESVLQQKPDLDTKGRPRNSDSARKPGSDVDRNRPSVLERPSGDLKNNPEPTPKVLPNDRNRGPSLVPDQTPGRGATNSLPGVAGRGTDRGQADRPPRIPRYRVQDQKQLGNQLEGQLRSSERPDSRPDLNRARQGMRIDPLDRMPPGGADTGRRGPGPAAGPATGGGSPPPDRATPARGSSDKKDRRNDDKGGN